MMRTMSSREFREWIAFDRLEPIGEIRADLRTGILCALVANMTKGRGQSRAKPTDFMPYHQQRTPKPRAQTPDEMKAVMQSMTRKLGGRIVKAGA